MSTAYTSLLGLALPTTGELDGAWGTTVNDAITGLLDTAVAGTTTLSTDADVTLTTTTGAANQARQAVLLCSGARTALRTITAPAQSKTYTVINATTGGFGVKLVGVGPTTGVTIGNGKKALVAWDGSDFVVVSSTDLSFSTGTLPVANGGTALTAAPTNGQLLVGNGTGYTLATLTQGAGVTITNGSGTITIAGTGGTVTTASVATANGFAGTVANASTTPAITLSTSVTGLVKGNGTALSAASAGTDYLAPPAGTAILKGNSGGALADAVAGTDYVAPGAVTGTGITMSTAKMLGRSTASTGAIEEIAVGSGLSLSAGTLSVSGGGTVTSVSVATANGFAGSSSGGAAPALTITTSVSGIAKGNGTALSAASAGTDYVAPGAYTGSGLTMATARILGRTTASTGAAEEITVGSGLSLSAGTLTATGSGGSVTTVSVATANGFAGSVSNPTTTPAITITTSVTGVLKGNGTTISAAAAGTDYVTPGFATGSGLTAAAASTLLGRYSAGAGALQELTVGSGIGFSTSTLVLTGAYTAAGLTMATSRLLGRTTASTGAAEEISIGSGLSLAAGTLSATGGTGTVTTVSVASANGFGGSVSNPTTTPAITITTSITGVLKGNGSAISAATAGTDYVAPGAYTTSGLTIATARLLGRTTAGSGAGEEISVGTGLSLSAGSLTCTVSSTPALSSLSAATGSNTISNSGNSQTWQWQLTSAAASVAGLTITESTASNNASTSNSQWLLDTQSLASSTAGPFRAVHNQYSMDIRLNGAGQVLIGKTSDPAIAMSSVGDVFLGRIAGGFIGVNNGVANGTVATTLGSVGPTGANAGNPLGWLKFQVYNGATYDVRYIPYW